jgi:hypothetical protein
MTDLVKWHFSGDASLEYGGAFIDLSTWSDGYCTAVRVTDLDSGCGFTGAVLIEHVVINGTTDSKRIRQALSCIGGPSALDARNWHAIGDRATIKANLRHAIADALMSYGFTDPDDCWDGYRSYHSETVQCEADGPMSFDGWKADKRIHNTTLEEYVKSVHLRD